MLKHVHIKSFLIFNVRNPSVKTCPMYIRQNIPRNAHAVQLSTDDDRVRTMIDTDVIRVSDFSLDSLTTGFVTHRFNEEKQGVSSWNSFFTPIIASGSTRRVTEFSLDCCPLLRQVYSRGPALKRSLSIKQHVDFRKPGYVQTSGGDGWKRKVLAPPRNRWVSNLSLPVNEP